MCIPYVYLWWTRNLMASYSRSRHSSVGVRTPKDSLVLNTHFLQCKEDVAGVPRLSCFDPGLCRGGWQIYRLHEKLTNILGSSMFLSVPLPFAPNSSLGATLWRVPFPSLGRFAPFPSHRSQTLSTFLKIKCHSGTSRSRMSILSLRRLRNWAITWSSRLRCSISLWYSGINVNYRCVNKWHDDEWQGS